VLEGSKVPAIKAYGELISGIEKRVFSVKNQKKLSLLSNYKKEKPLIS
jgi:hypothetical protein